MQSTAKLPITSNCPLSFGSRQHTGRVLEGEEDSSD